MSLTSSTHSLSAYREKVSNQEIHFHRQPSYITLCRTLTRLSNSLLPLSPSNNVPHSDLTPDQQLTFRDLLSPLPYHRTKTLHTVEHARTLLLQLEQSAQNIKIQRVKRDVVRDLAEKRKVVRKLRAVVEELGREAERREREGVPQGDGDDYEEGETVEELLGLPPLEEERRDKRKFADNGLNGVQKEGHESALKTPIPSPPTNNQPKSSTTSKSQQPKEDLSNLRHRRPKTTTTDNLNSPPSNQGATTSTATEKQLLHTDRLTQSTLTDSLLNLASQLKSQSLTLSTTLQTSDKSYLDRALAGLDSNVSGLQSASKKMGLLSRMSEGEGWWGRIMLYLWIWGLWAVAVGLVFLGPKFRF